MTILIETINFVLNYTISMFYSHMLSSVNKQDAFGEIILTFECFMYYYLGYGSVSIVTLLLFVYMYVLLSTVIMLYECILCRL